MFNRPHTQITYNRSIPALQRIDRVGVARHHLAAAARTRTESPSIPPACVCLVNAARSEHEQYSTPGWIFFFLSLFQISLVESISKFLFRFVKFVFLSENDCLKRRRKEAEDEKKTIDKMTVCVCVCVCVYRTQVPRCCINACRARWVCDASRYTNRSVSATRSTCSSANAPPSWTTYKMPLTSHRPSEPDSAAIAPFTALLKSTDTGHQTVSFQPSLNTIHCSSSSSPPPPPPPPLLPIFIMLFTCVSFWQM